MSLLQPTNNLQIVENVTVSASDVKVRVGKRIFIFLIENNTSTALILTEP